MSRFEVIVSNVGNVHASDDIDEATAQFTDYVEWSRGTVGRPCGEDVTMLEDGEILMEHTGWLSMEMNDE